MSQTLTVTNISINTVVVDGTELVPGVATTVDRKRLVIPKEGGVFEYSVSAVYTELYNLLTDGYISVSYDSVALTAANLASLATLDTDYDDKLYEVSLPFDDGGAANAVSRTWTAPYKCRVVDVFFTASAAITAHAVNYATFLISNRTDTQTVMTAVTTEITGTGDIAQWAVYDMSGSIDTDYDEIDADDVLEFTLAKAAGGVAVAGEFKFVVKRIF